MAKEKIADLMAEARQGEMPGHIAIIMDGNGRWAKKRRFPRVAGHVMGARRVPEIVTISSDIGVKTLSLYAFSTENWSRPTLEVSALMRLLVKYLRQNLKKLLQKEIRFVVSGRLDVLPAAARKEVEKVIETSRDNKGMIFNLCLNYGGRQEIVDAAKKIAAMSGNGELAAADVNEQIFQDCLYHPETGDVDLMIRTSGEERISNFLLWQLAYSELYFTPAYWPDFTKIDLLKAIIAFQKRERRFGGI